MLRASSLLLGTPLAAVDSSAGVTKTQIMLRRLRASRRWNGPASPLKTRAREFALGASLWAIWLALKAVHGTAPAPVEWLASAGVFLILLSLLPESDPDPVPAVEKRPEEPTSLADWLQIAFNLLVVAMFAGSLLLLWANHLYGVRLFAATVGAGLVCALVNHIRNGPPYRSD